MKKILFVLLIIAIFASGALMGQKKNDKLTVKTSLIKNKYYKGVWNISQEKTLGYLSENGEAYALITKGLKLQKTSKIMMGVGTAMVLFSTISALVGADDPRWFVAGIGGGAILISIPIYSTGHKRTHEAIEVYNEQVLLKKITQRRGIEKVNLFAGESGIGLRLTF